MTNSDFMKTRKRYTFKALLTTACCLLLGGAAVYIIAADHIDSPAVTGSGSDITDFYSFENPTNEDNIVFVVNVQGLLSPAATADASFDEEIMIEINIDNSSSKDNLEDIVIQASFDDGMVQLYGPAAPETRGLTSGLVGTSTVSAGITGYGQTPVVGEANGVKVFAGPRDDPFFFDLTAYQSIINGTATQFNDPGNDTFAGTNVLALVIEVPKAMIGSGDSINAWVTSNRKM